MLGGHDRIYVPRNLGELKFSQRKASAHQFYQIFSIACKKLKGGEVDKIQHNEKEEI